MSWWMILSIGMIGLLFVLALGVPIFVGFLLLNIIGVTYLIGANGVGMFANSVYTTGTFAELAAIPLFVLMGEVLFRSGSMEVLLDGFDRIIGKIVGRQYILCVSLSAILGALSGSAMAVAGMLANTLYPAMRKRGYDKKLSAGAILGGASLSPIIPPSVLAVVIATLAQVSTGKLLIAGVIPGIFLAALFVAYILLRIFLNRGLSPDVEEVAATSVGEIILTILKMMPVGLIFFMVIGLIMLGVATPTESAAAGVAGTVIVAFIYGGFSRRMIGEALMSSVKISGTLLIIMACAALFSQLVTYSGTVSALAALVSKADIPLYMMLALLLLIPFVLFMFLDQVSILMVLIPIYQPIINAYNMDPLWFWALILVVSTVGGISPPFGYTLFAFQGAAPKEVTMKDAFSAAWPFVGLIILGIIAMIVFPSLITWLPNVGNA